MKNIGIKIEINKRFQIIKAARSYIGTPFKHQGRDKNGLDCVGLIIAVGKDCNLLPPDFDIRDYSQNFDYKRIMAECDKILLARDKIFPGSIVLMWVKSILRPRHLGIFAIDSIIYANDRVGKVIERFLDFDSRKKICRVYDYKDL